MAKASAVASGELLNLDPKEILADDNTRFGLKDTRIQSLASSIVSTGGVMEPVEVELIQPGANGHKYRLTTGFYRLAAVEFLNKTQAAGLTVPAIVRESADTKSRLKRQLAENMERENQSPMDQAIAIKRLLDAGLSKMEVREVFSRPGGRKGNKIQPASNSFINMTLSFLELPKSVQEKIHNGLIGVAAAYELTKVPAEKRTAVLERAEQERQKALETEERDEEKLLAREKKEAEENAKKQGFQDAVTQTEATFNQAQETLKNKTTQAAEAYAASRQKFDNAKDKKAAATAFKEAEKVRAIAEADFDAAKKEYEAAMEKFEKYVASKAAKVAGEKPAKAGKEAKKVSSADVKKAAVKEKASTQHVALNAAEMRKVVSELTLPGSHAAVIAIAVAFQRCFSGEITDEQLRKELTKIVS
ncbi:hypothetical protein KGP36_03460 [Patescibacteria group bacterium]|nr:hypothetical protein [Patescibacteria group bacterium]